MKILNDVDFNKRELKNMVLDKLASAPSSPVTGQVYYNTTDKRIYIYKDGDWVEVGGSSGGSCEFPSVPPANEVTQKKTGNISSWCEKTNAELLTEINAYGLDAVFYPLSVDAVDIYDSSPTLNQASFSDMKNRIDYLKANDMEVYIELFPMVSEGSVVETEWNPTNINLWFEKWGEVALEVAEYAEQKGVGAINICSNLVYMTPYHEKWKDIIDDIREVYSGLIFFRANWWYDNNGYLEVYNNPVYNYVDVISVACYFEISATTSPTVSQLKSHIRSTTVWDRGQDVYQELKNISDKFGKFIFFGELGCPPYSQAPSQPWDYSPVGTYDESTQSNWYQAFYEVFSDEDWFLGYSIFAIGQDDSIYSPYGKAAEVTIRNQILDKVLVEGVEVFYLNAENISITNAKNKFKSKSVEGALEEVFTFGNSKKSELVDKLLSIDNSLPITQNDTWETILNAVETIESGGSNSVKFLGEVTGTRNSNTVITFNLSSLVDTGHNIDDFIVQLSEFRAIRGSAARDCALTYTFNSNTRILTVTSNNDLFTTGGNGFRANIWQIVEIEKEPEERNWVLATDDDFEVQLAWGIVSYVGNDEWVTIPKKIKGIDIEDFYSVQLYDYALPFNISKGFRFEDAESIFRLKSTFAGSVTEILYLDEFDVSNIDNFEDCFGYLAIKKLDLRNWYIERETPPYTSQMFSEATIKELDISTWNFENMDISPYTFTYARITKCYVRSQDDIDYIMGLEDAEELLSFVNFIVK